jgi:TatD DNase family protein
MSIHGRRLYLLPDTHAHLDASVFAADLDQVLTRAQQVGIDRVLAVGQDLASSREAISLSHRYPMIYAAVGVHPHEAHKFQEEAAEIEALLNDKKVVAVGEIGLDYRRSSADRQVQLDVFSTQLGWAAARDLVVSVHNRDADDDIIGVLGETSVTAVLHCFSGPWQVAERALHAGHYLSFAGNITYPKAGSLREVASQVPLDRVLLETDAPVLAPQRWRGRRNEPSYLLDALSVFAAVRELGASQVAAHLTANSNRLFGWGAA